MENQLDDFNVPLRTATTPASTFQHVRRSLTHSPSDHSVNSHLTSTPLYDSTPARIRQAICRRVLSRSSSQTRIYRRRFSSTSSSDNSPSPSVVTQAHSIPDHYLTRQQLETQLEQTRIKLKRQSLSHPL